MLMFAGVLNYLTLFLKESISAESQAALAKIFSEHQIYRQQFSSNTLQEFSVRITNLCCAS